MYHIAVSFEVSAEHHREFVDAALHNARESLAGEPGTLRFELINDPDDPNHYYLDEAYVDEAAFDIHRDGPHFARFFDAIGGFASGPTWLIKGQQIFEHG